MSLKVRGEQLYLFTGSAAQLVPIGCSTDCSIHFSADAIETSRRGQGSWRTYRAGQKEWSVDCAGFFFESNAPTSFRRGRDAIGTVTKVAITLLESEMVEAGLDISTLTPNTSHTLIGDAVVTKCSYAGSRGGLATYSISFLGSGELSSL